MRADQGSCAVVLGGCGDGKTRYIWGRKGTNVTGFVGMLGGLGGGGSPSHGGVGNARFRTFSTGNGVTVVTHG